MEVDTAAVCLVQNNVKKISELLGEVTPARYEAKEKTGGKDEPSPCPTEPNTAEAYQARLASFGPGQWVVREVSPVECCRYGWRVIEAGVLQCVTCKQVVCALLPSLTHQSTYKEFLEKLKKQVVEGHHEACWWRCSPVPLHHTRPHPPATREDLFNLTNSAHTLRALESALPQLDNSDLMARLSIDEEFVEKFYSTKIITEAHTTAVLLVLTGWLKGSGAYLRCKECCRSVGLWSVRNRAVDLITAVISDHHAQNSTPVTPGKRKTRESEGSCEESVFSSPEKDEECEARDIQSSWRFRLRERRVSEQSSDDTQARKKKTSERFRKSSSSTTSIISTEAKEGSSTNTISTTTTTTTSTTTTIPSPQPHKVEKRHFHPLEEHRLWCPWLSVTEGYHSVVDGAKLVIEKDKNIHPSRIIEGNVEGIRLVRKLLDDFVREDP